MFQPLPAGSCPPPLSSSREPPPTFRAMAGGCWCWSLRACSAVGLGVLAGCSPPTCAQPRRSTNCATTSGCFIRPPWFALHFGRCLSSLPAPPAFTPLAGAGWAVGVCAFRCSAVRAVSRVRYVKLHLLYVKNCKCKRVVLGGWSWLAVNARQVKRALYLHSIW